MIIYKIAVLEPDKTFHYALQLMFQYSRVFYNMGIFQSISAFLCAVKEIPEVFLVSTAMAEKISWLKKTFPAARIILIIRNHTEKRLISAMASGAEAFICKGKEPADFLYNAKNSSLNKTRLNHHPATHILPQNPSGDSEPILLFLLTTRENEILHLLASGKLYKEIAAQLSISLATVKRHCFNIYKKLKVDNRTEAINKLFYNK